MIYTIKLITNEIFINISKLSVLLNTVLHYIRCPIYCYILITAAVLVIHNRETDIRRLTEWGRVSEIQEDQAISWPLSPTSVALDGFSHTIIKLVTVSLSIHHTKH